MNSCGVWGPSKSGSLPCCSPCFRSARPKVRALTKTVAATTIVGVSVGAVALAAPCAVVAASGYVVYKYGTVGWEAMNAEVSDGWNG